MIQPTKCGQADTLHKGDVLAFPPTLASNGLAKGRKEAKRDAELEAEDETLPPEGTVKMDLPHLLAAERSNQLGSVAMNICERTSANMCRTFLHGPHKHT